MNVKLKDILEVAAHYALLTDLADALSKGSIHLLDGVAQCEDLSEEDLEALNLLLQSAKNVLQQLNVSSVDFNNLDCNLPPILPCNKPRVMGYGLMAEYCKLDDRPHDVNQWLRRYNDALLGKN